MGSTLEADTQHLNYLAGVHPLGRLKGSWGMIGYGALIAAFLLLVTFGGLVRNPDLEELGRAVPGLLFFAGLLALTVLYVRWKIRQAAAAGFYDINDKLIVSRPGKHDLEIPWTEVEAIVLKRRLREGVFGACATVQVHGPDGQLVKLAWVDNAEVAAWRLRRRAARAWLAEN